MRTLPAKIERPGSNSRQEIAGLLLTRFHLLVFYDYHDGRYRFERWENGKLIDSKSCVGSETGLLTLFAENVQSIAQQHIISDRLSKKPINMMDMPHGMKGIRTFDPRKRNTNRSVFDIYKQQK